MITKSRSEFSEMVVKSRSDFSEKRQNRLVPSRLLWGDKTHPHQGFQPWHERRDFDDSSLSCFVFASSFIDLADRLRRVPRDFPICQKARTDRKNIAQAFFKRKRDDGKRRIVLKKVYTFK